MAHRSHRPPWRRDAAHQIPRPHPGRGSCPLTPTSSVPTKLARVSRETVTIVERIAHREAGAGKNVPHPADVSAPLANLAKPGGCRAGRLVSRLAGPDSGSLAIGYRFYMGCGATNRVGHAPTLPGTAGYPARAKLHRIAWTPLSPSTSASAGVTSKSGRGVNGPRSTTVVSTVCPPNSTKIFAPHGSTG
jgi:hypothetical protein